MKKLSQLSGSFTDWRRLTCTLFFVAQTVKNAFLLLMKRIGGMTVFLCLTLFRFMKFAGVGFSNN
jgi:hypothetical protein